MTNKDACDTEFDESGSDEKSKDIEENQENSESNSSGNLEDETMEVPREITELHTCPMCLKKYASESDMENHIAMIHKIARKFQKEHI